MKKIFFIVCESSGDKFASDIIKLLPQDDFEIIGTGGDRMLEAGVKNLFYHIKDFSVMGFWEVLKKAFSLKKIISDVAKKILEEKPNCVLSFDSYSFCIRVAKIVKKQNPNIKFIHCIAPSVWLYGEHKAKIMARYYNKLFCVLPFEPEYFTKEGIDAEFIGYHALYFEQNKIDIDNEYFKICITLGSRIFEVKNNIKMIKKITEIISIAKKSVKFYFPCVDNEILNFVKDEFKNINHFAFINNEKVEIPKYDFAIAKSGTNTIEFAKNQEPMVVYYKISKISEFILRKKCKNFKYANLINIIAKKEIIREFLQEKCNAEEISAEVLSRIFFNKNNLPNQQDEVDKIIEQMKSPKDSPASIVSEYLLNKI